MRFITLLSQGIADEAEGPSEPERALNTDRGLFALKTDFGTIGLDYLIEMLREMIFE